MFTVLIFFSLFYSKKLKFFFFFTLSKERDSKKKRQTIETTKCNKNDILKPRIDKELVRQFVVCCLVFELNVVFVDLEAKINNC